MNRIPTISATFVQTASEKTKSDYAKEINKTLKQEDNRSLTKTWAAILDNATRVYHAEADGQTVNIDDFFVVNNELLEEPGDPRFASLSNLINCRCCSIINF